MSDSLRRVTIEISPEHMLDLMAHIGPFVAKHNLSIQFADSTPTDAVEVALRYNPNRVSWFTEGGTAEKTAVVTKSCLFEFERECIALENDTAKSLGRTERIFNATLRNIKYGDGVSRPYLHIEDQQMQGFLAAELPLFAERVLNGDLDITNLGEKSGEFLVAYCKDLIVTE